MIQRAWILQCDEPDCGAVRIGSEYQIRKGAVDDGWQSSYEGKTYCEQHKKETPKE